MTFQGERVLALAQGLHVAISAERPAWLALLPALEPHAETHPDASLRLLANDGDLGLEELPGPFAFRAALDWTSASHAVFRVPGGAGWLELDDAPAGRLRAELRLAPRREAGAIETTLRMLSGVLLPARCGALLHASAVVIGGQGVLLLGSSGAGKTTTARRLGWEGALRIADDLVVARIGLDASGGAQPGVESFLFDRAANLPGRRAMSWRLTAAYLLVKNAPVTALGPLVEAPLASWCSALFAPRLGPRLGTRLLDRVMALAQRVPCVCLRLPPPGP